MKIKYKSIFLQQMWDLFYFVKGVFTLKENRWFRVTRVLLKYAYVNTTNIIVKGIKRQIDTKFSFQKIW